MEQSPQNKRAASDAELKQVIQSLSDAEVLVSDLTQGFSFSEIGALIRVGGDLPAILSDASILWPEYAALDSAAQADLVAFVQANCKFPANVAVEAWVQKVLQAAILLSSIVAVFA